MAAYDYPLLVQHILTSGVARSGGAAVSGADGPPMDYRELDRRVRRLGSALLAVGVRAGDVVAVMEWDTRRYLECFFAVPAIAAQLQMVNMRLSLEQIAYTLSKTGARTLLYGSDFDTVIAQLRPQLPADIRLIRLPGVDCPTDGTNHSLAYEQLMARGDDMHRFADFDENTPATVFFTTGTTGLPKGVTFTHRQLVLHTLALLSAFALSPQARFSSRAVYMPMTPMFHVHAWGFPFAATLGGMKQVYPGRYTAEGLLRLVLDEKVSFSHCVPTILRMLLDEAGDELDLSGLSIVVGGSALPQALAERAARRGIDIFGGYGMSEACPVLTLSLNHADEPGGASVRDRIQAGQPIPLVQLELMDESGSTLGNDGLSAGEIVARAPWLTQAYLGDDDATAALWDGDFLHTRDIGIIRPDGHLTITDRLKDVIKSGGEWISSLELEELISMHPDVAEVAVIGLPDAKWGERALPVIVLVEGRRPVQADLLAPVAARIEEGALPRFAMPSEVVFRASIPRTSVGKHDKRALRQSFA